MNMISSPSLNRRSFLRVSAPFALVAPLISALGLPALAQGAAPAAAPDLKELMTPGPLGDQILGKADAPVTIIEYASLTCGHCASFHETTYPVLKEKYIDTGKVRLIFRDFPLDQVAMAASMLARCAGENKYFPLVDLFFKQQKIWAFSDKPIDALLSLVRQAGFTQESFEACLKNQTVYDGVLGVRTKAAEKFAVNSTPSFFINGIMERGTLTPKLLEERLEPLLAGK